MPSAPPPLALLPGEVVLRHETFTPRTFLVYLKTTMILTNRRLVVSSPNTVFAVIPYGFSVHSAPIDHVTDVGCGNGRKTGAVSKLVTLSVAGMVLLGFAMFLFSSLEAATYSSSGGGEAWGVLILPILIAIGVVMWILGAKTYLIARTGSGTTMGTGTSTGERPAAEEMYSMIVAESMAARDRIGGGASGASPRPPVTGHSLVGAASHLSSPSVQKAPPPPPPPPPPRR